MVYKLWMHLTDLLAAYMANPTDETEARLLAFQEKVDWPWSASDEQLIEWNELSRHLEGHFAQAIN